MATVRLEVRTAFAIGILLPFLETCRRGFDHWFVDFTTMFEDYGAGLLLLFAGAISVWGRRSAGSWLLLAWSGVTAMMSVSFLDQLEVTLRGAETEPNNGIVLLFKFLLWGTFVTSLLLSFRRAHENCGA